MVILVCAQFDVMKKGIWGFRSGDIKTTWRGRGDWTRLDFADYKDHCQLREDSRRILNILSSKCKVFCPSIFSVQHVWRTRYHSNLRWWFGSKGTSELIHLLRLHEHAETHWSEWGSLANSQHSTDLHLSSVNLHSCYCYINIFTFWWMPLYVCLCAHANKLNDSLGD